MNIDPKEYPLCFNGKNKFLFECGPGWEKILRKALNIIEQEIAKSEDPESMFVTQIKEKWGTLRIYMSYETDKISSVIERAEDKSEDTCEICGDPGELQAKGWYKVRCLKCRENERIHRLSVRSFDSSR